MGKFNITKICHYSIYFISTLRLVILWKLMIRLMTKEKENKSPNISDRTLEIGDREKSGSRSIKMCNMIGTITNRCHSSKFIKRRHKPLSWSLCLRCNYWSFQWEAHQSILIYCCPIFTLHWTHRLVAVTWIAVIFVLNWPVPGHIFTGLFPTVKRPGIYFVVAHEELIKLS